MAMIRGWAEGWKRWRLVSRVETEMRPWKLPVADYICWAKVLSIISTLPPPSRLPLTHTSTSLPSPRLPFLAFFS
ncbi:hypothetical protein E2C01_058025 [Portunus trituberculatus]|uniref:Uncharacterized protein n=1 Tax=Portunus trituberculatus TaxID=210409 RepID=A0A5B7H3J7_PORTR|nr:hypothetical protein [Portunus trituberculatus]